MPTWPSYDKFANSANLMNAPQLHNSSAPQLLRQLATVDKLPLTAVRVEGAPEASEATKAEYTLHTGGNPVR